MVVAGRRRGQRRQTGATVATSTHRTKVNTGKTLRRGLQRSAKPCSQSLFRGNRFGRDAVAFVREREWQPRGRPSGAEAVWRDDGVDGPGVRRADGLAVEDEVEIPDRPEPDPELRPFHGDGRSLDHDAAVEHWPGPIASPYLDPRVAARAGDAERHDAHRRRGRLGRRRGRSRRHRKRLGRRRRQIGWSGGKSGGSGLARRRGWLRIGRRSRTGDERDVDVPAPDHDVEGDEGQSKHDSTEDPGPTDVTAPAPGPLLPLPGTGLDRGKRVE